MNLYSDAEILQNALKNLREEKDSDRFDLFQYHILHFSSQLISVLSFRCLHRRSLVLIKSHVETALRELSLESFAKFETELYQVTSSLPSLLLFADLALSLALSFLYHLPSKYFLY
jgi:hypothetical protein